MTGYKGKNDQGERISHRTTEKGGKEKNNQRKKGGGEGFLLSPKKTPDKRTNRAQTLQAYSEDQQREEFTNSAWGGRGDLEDAKGIFLWGREGGEKSNGGGERGQGLHKQGVARGILFYWRGTLRKGGPIIEG